MNKKERHYLRFAYTFYFAAIGVAVLIYVLTGHHL